MNDLLDMNVKSDDISLEDRVGMLNADQRRIFDKVKNTSNTNNSMKTSSVSVT